MAEPLSDAGTRVIGRAEESTARVSTAWGAVYFVQPTLTV